MIALLFVKGYFRPTSILPRMFLYDAYVLDIAANFLFQKLFHGQSLFDQSHLQSFAGHSRSNFKVCQLSFLSRKSI